jgi:DNA-directed RNA polymerase specialized sigma24 family protein
VKIMNANWVAGADGEDGRFEPQIPGELRRVVCLKLIGGCSFVEIATLIGSSEAAAKMRFQRGLATPRQALEREGIRPGAT